MQVYANSYKDSIKILLALFLILVIAYLPISTFLFVLKNDSFTGYFPPKFFMSESLHAGYLPIWNPYINYGFPQYADMSSGFWNPITWLIAGTFGYNAYTYTIEELFYILTAGIGMYYLGSIWGISRRVRFIAAVSYMCCGYMVGHLDHLNWICGASFLPWCLFSYLFCIQRPNWKRMIFAAISFYMLVSSSHPGIIIGSVYFFAAIGIAKAIIGIQKKKEHFVQDLTITHLWLGLLCLLISFGLIVSYIEIIPFISRGGMLPFDLSFAEPTTFQSWITFLFPFSASRNIAFNYFFHNDHAMRNCYIGLLMFLFLAFTIVSKKNKWQIFLLIFGFAFLLLSAGGIFKSFGYNWAPLIGYVRLAGEFRIYALFSFILAATMSLDQYIRNGWKYRWALRWLLNAGFVVWITTIGWSGIMILSTNESIFYDLRIQGETAGVTNFLKKAIDSFSFYDCLAIQGTIQLILWFGIYVGIHKRKFSYLVIVTVIDLSLAALLNIPYTGVSQNSVADFQRIIDQSPKKIPIPKMQPVTQNPIQTPEIDRKIGPWGWYSKQIGTVDPIFYPITFKSTLAFYASKWKDSADLKPFVFFEDGYPGGTIEVRYFSPTKIILNTSTVTDRDLVLKQNFYRGWKCTVDNNYAPIDSAEITFMRIRLQKGVHDVKFEFSRPGILWSLWINLSIVVLGFAIVLIAAFKKKAFFI